VHVTHAVWPASSWYVPAPHLSHDPCSVSGCTVPALQSVGVAAPIEQKAPAGHTRQSSALVITSSASFWYLPDGQSTGATAPASQ